MKYLLLSGLILFFGIIGFLNPLRNFYQKMISPIQFGLNSSALDIKESFNFYKNLKDLRNENISLKNKIILLESDLVEQRQLKNELYLLKGVIKVSGETAFADELILTEVMGNPLDLTGSTVYISSGSTQGVVKGANIVFGKQIIGIVKEVGSEKSLVELVTSPDISFTAFNTDSANKTEGLATGDYGTSIKLSRILPSEEIKAGDLIFTSGKDGFIMPNLLVGKVESVIEDPSQPLKSAVVKTSTDFTKLTKVFIVKER